MNRRIADQGKVLTNYPSKDWVGERVCRCVTYNDYRCSLIGDRVMES